METKFKDIYTEAAQRVDAIVNNALGTIRSNVEKAGGELKIGNITLRLENGTVTFGNDSTSLYSEDGWDDPFDICHWADVTTDAINCYASGRKEYSQLWNVKK